MVRERERLALHGEIKRLRDRVRDAEGEFAFTKVNFRDAVIARPAEISTGDF